ncbi:hypothetical protein HY214_04670 [Candidatus Roizmanbacteria bacterium]|nr:hypothetical protein [Candidatus Roizmanbacteria bacterium]
MVKNYTPIDHLLKKQRRTPLGSPAKEMAPKSPRSESFTIQEVIEHEPEETVKPYVQARPETIKVTPELQTAGVQPAATIQFPTYGNMKLPLADEKVLTGLHAPLTSSIRWLATLTVYILKLAHLKLRKIHGKVMRVVSR